MVKTNDDIVEMKRKQYTQIEDGTTKVSVISKQFLNITSWKRQLARQLVEHVAGDEESNAGVVVK